MIWSLYCTRFVCFCVETLIRMCLFVNRTKVKVWKFTYEQNPALLYKAAATFTAIMILLTFPTRICNLPKLVRSEKVSLPIKALFFFPDVTVVCYNKKWKTYSTRVTESFFCLELYHAVYSQVPWASVWQVSFLQWNSVVNTFAIIAL
jgi:hypothetical protein